MEMCLSTTMYEMEITFACSNLLLLSRCKTTEILYCCSRQSIAHNVMGVRTLKKITDKWFLEKKRWTSNMKFSFTDNMMNHVIELNAIHCSVHTDYITRISLTLLSFLHCWFHCNKKWQKKKTNCENWMP